MSGFSKIFRNIARAAATAAPEAIPLFLQDNGPDNGTNSHDTPCRTLENPQTRVALPDHIKHSHYSRDRAAMIAALRRGAEQNGHDWDSLPRITIAWPQKHPHGSHTNQATPFALRLREALREELPHKDIVLAHGLYETVKLGRSENSGVIRSITQAQHFRADPALQDGQDLPFLTTAGAKGECFVLTDWFISQGTTIASLGSYIQHNGGHIAGVIAPSEPVFLRPRAATRADLQHAFNAAANHDIPPSARPVLLDYALARHGHSVAALTECEMRDMNQHISEGAGLSGFARALGVPARVQYNLIAAHLDQTAPDQAQDYRAKQPALRRAAAWFSARPA